MNNYFSINFFSQICLSGTVLSSVVYQVTSVWSSDASMFKKLLNLKSYISQMSPFSDFVRFAYNMTFMITISTQAFLNSYFGNSISIASEELSNAAYSSKWYVMSKAYRTDLMVLMERLKINSQLMAGKLFPMNLPLFSTVIKQNVQCSMLIKDCLMTQIQSNFCISDYELCLQIIFNFKRWLILKMNIKCDEYYSASWMELQNRSQLYFYLFQIKVKSCFIAHLL